MSPLEHAHLDKHSDYYSLPDRFQLFLADSEQLDIIHTTSPFVHMRSFLAVRDFALPIAPL